MDTAELNQDIDIKRFEYILNAQVAYEVTKYINNAIKPTIDSLVKDIASEAVKNWTTHIKAELEAMSYSTKIQINFVENVVNTVMKESPVNIEVNKG